GKGSESVLIGGRRGAGLPARRPTPPAVRPDVTSRDEGWWEAMPKSRSTIPIVHADNVPTIAFTDEEWQAIEHTFGQQLNADVRQQVTTVTAQYCKDCVFEPAAPKEIALKRIERVRRAAGDLERLIFDREVFSTSDALSRRQQNSAHSYADGLIRRHLLRHDGVGFHSTAQIDLF